MCRATMVSMVLVLCAVVTAATNPTHPDCVFCLRGKCLAPAAFFENRKFLDPVKMTMNYKDNIMYYDDRSTIKAINLDTNTFVQIPNINAVSNKFEIDETNGDLYYYKHFKREEHQNTIHKYLPKTNETKIILVPNPDNKKPLYRLRIYNGTLYFTRHQNRKAELEKGLNVFDGTTLQRVAVLENTTVSDINFDAFGKLYIKSARKVYKIKNANGVEELSQIGQATDLVGNCMSGKNGELYIFDTGKNLIYQLDPSTEQFNKIGAYEQPNYAKQVMLDKNNNIIIRNRYSISYYKVSNDQCVFDMVDRKVKVTKI